MLTKNFTWVILRTLCVRRNRLSLPPNCKFEVTAPTDLNCSYLCIQQQQKKKTVDLVNGPKEEGKAEW
jgi:hypothetical protein